MRFYYLLSGREFHLIDKVLTVSAKPERACLVGRIGQLVDFVLTGVGGSHRLCVEHDEPKLHYSYAGGRGLAFKYVEKCTF